jgi:hypothetical protein
VKTQEYVDKAVAIKVDDPDGLKAILNPVPATTVPAVKTPATTVPAVKTQTTPAPKIPKK